MKYKIKLYLILIGQGSEIYLKTEKSLGIEKK